MIVTYCDSCGDEINGKNQFKNLNVEIKGDSREKGVAGVTKIGVLMKVTLASELHKQSNDVCIYCVFDAISDQDDRPCV